MTDKLSEFLAEAKRRRVFRTAGVYLVAVWGISSGGVDVFGVFGIPEEVLRFSMIGAIAFLPVVVILAWMFDIGRGGIVRDPQDVAAERAADQEMASMPTIIGGNMGAGAVVVHWGDGSDENSMLYIEEFYLGRGADCRVRFYDPLVSRQHARAFHEDGTWFIEDLGSRNGTHVDGVAIDNVPLGASNAVRLNDSGPFLRIDLIPPGGATRSALAAYPPGQPTAHVRGTGSTPGSGSRPETRKR